MKRISEVIDEMELDGEPIIKKEKTRRKSLSKRIRFEVLKRDKFTCRYCGAKAPDVVLCVDHIRAVADGGTNDILNLVTACQDCNSGKSDRRLDDHSITGCRRAQAEAEQNRINQIKEMSVWVEDLAANRTIDSRTILKAFILGGGNTSAAEDWFNGVYLNEEQMDIRSKFISQLNRVVGKFDLKLLLEIAFEIGQKNPTTIPHDFAQQLQKIARWKLNPPPYPKEIYGLRKWLEGRANNRGDWYSDTTHRKVLDNLYWLWDSGRSIEQITTIVKTSVSAYSFNNECTEMWNNEKKD